MQPPSADTHTADIQEVAPRATLSWYRRWDALLGLTIIAILMGGAAMWLGIDWYARSQWAVEMARLKATGQPMTIEEMAHIGQTTPHVVTLARAGAVTAYFTRRLQSVLIERDLFQENPRLNTSEVFGQNRSVHRCTFNEIFTRFPIKALARAMREGAFEPQDLPALAALPLEIQDLRKRAAWELQVNICRIADEGEECLSRETQLNYWRRMSIEMPEANAIIRYGPKSTYCLLLAKILQDLERRQALYQPTVTDRKLLIPKSLPDDGLRMTPFTVTLISPEIDCIAGALLSNTQRIIVAFAQYRATHGRNPQNVSELLEDTSVRNKLITIEGAQLDYAVEPRSGKITLRYSLDPALCTLAHQCESILSENWDINTPVNVISAVLYDPRDAPKLKAKDEDRDK